MLVHFLVHNFDSGPSWTCDFRLLFSSYIPLSGVKYCSKDCNLWASSIRSTDVKGETVGELGLETIPTSFLTLR